MPLLRLQGQENKPYFIKITVSRRLASETHTPHEPVSGPAVDHPSHPQVQRPYPQSPLWLHPSRGKTPMLR